MSESIATKRATLNDRQPIHAVDPETAEHLLSTAQLGQRIRRMRLKRSMGLVELGKQTGLSASFLSQLETGRVVPTLRNLARLAHVFGKDMSFFFEGEGRNVFRIQRAKDRLRLHMGSPDTTYISESFGIVVPDEGLRPCMAEFLPGEHTQPFQPDTTPGIEMVYVLEGSLLMSRGAEQHVLEQHDALYVSSDISRTYRCNSTTPAKAMIISFDTDRR